MYTDNFEVSANNKELFVGDPIWLNPMMVGRTKLLSKTNTGTVTKKLLHYEQVTGYRKMVTLTSMRLQSSTSIITGTAMVITMSLVNGRVVNLFQSMF